MKRIIALSLILLGLGILGCGSGNVKKARELLDLGLFEQAVELLEQEIKEHPKNAEAHFILANTNAELLFKFKPERDSEWERETAKKAIESYKAAIQLKPNDFNARYNLAVFLYSYDDAFEEDEREKLRERMVQEFKEVIRIQPKHTGAHVYLAQVSSTEEAYQEYQKAFALKPLGKEWKKLPIVASNERRYEGTFIVKVDSADLHVAETDEVRGQLQKYDIGSFKSRNQNKLFFVDTSDPIYVPDKGWLLKRTHTREHWWSGYLITKKTEDFKGRTHIVERPYSDEERISVSEIQPNSIKPTGNHRKDTNDYTTYYFDEVTFKRRKYLLKWIDVESVVIGTGYTDSRRVSFVKSPLLSEIEKDYYFNGLITKGMPMSMIYALGIYPSITKFSPSESGVTIIYELGDDLEFTFQDGQLASWSEKGRQ